MLENIAESAHLDAQAACMLDSHLLFTFQLCIEKIASKAEGELKLESYNVNQREEKMTC